MDAKENGVRISRRLAAYDEVWMQKLISDYPKLIEVGERLDNLIPLTREFSLNSGRIDNIFVRPDGSFVLVEVKLWRNKESKKDVFTQICRYHKEFSSISATEILRRVKILGTISDIAIARIKNRISSTEDTANDLGVTVVIVSDHIRDELRSTLHGDAEQLGQSVDLVQLNFHEINGGCILIIPKLIQRHEVDMAIARVGDSESPGSLDVMDLDIFYKNVALNNSDNIATIKEFLRRIDGKGFFLHFSGRNLIIKSDLISGESKSVLSFYPKHIEFWQFTGTFQSGEWRALSHEYLMAVREYVPGSELSYHKQDIDLKIRKKYIPIEAAQPHISAIADLFMQAVERGRLIAQMPGSLVSGM
jgi:uncharacterized protein YlzI (FlbEa/FlbD family)